MHLDVWVHWDTSVLCTYSIGDTFVADWHSNAKGYWSERMAVWTKGGDMNVTAAPFLK